MVATFPLSTEMHDAILLAKSVLVTILAIENKTNIKGT